MKEIEDYIKFTKKQVENADLNLLNYLSWQIRNNRGYLESYVRQLEDLEEEVEDKIEHSKGEQE